MNKYDLMFNVMYKICININYRGRSFLRVFWVNESKVFLIDNMCIYVKNIEIILYIYEVEKNF